MNVLPRRIQDQLDWFDQRGPVWAAATTGPTNIGITPQQAADFEALAREARAAYQEQLAALEAARVATARMRRAVSAAFERAGELVATIKATAEGQEGTESQAIYAAAQIPAPQRARPNTMDAPGKPEGLTIDLTPTTGEMRIAWRCRNPRNAKGTVYIVRRRVGGQVAFEFVGVTGEKSLRDVPPLSQSAGGPIVVEYVVQAQRGGSMGPMSDVFTVQVGANVGASRVRMAA